MLLLLLLLLKCVFCFYCLLCLSILKIFICLFVVRAFVERECILNTYEHIAIGRVHTSTYRVVHTYVLNLLLCGMLITCWNTVGKLRKSEAKKPRILKDVWAVKILAWWVSSSPAGSHNRLCTNVCMTVVCVLREFVVRFYRFCVNIKCIFQWMSMRICGCVRVWAFRAINFYEWLHSHQAHQKFAVVVFLFYYFVCT